MNSEYVPIDNQHRVKRWRWFDIVGFITIITLSIIGVRLLLEESDETMVNIEQPVGALTEIAAPVLANKPRLYAEGFSCEPGQAPFVYHTISNVAKLANVNRDSKDKDGLQETFIFYEAYATVKPPTSCNQLWLLEAFPNEKSEKLHQKAASKNGLEILQTLRGSSPDDGLPGFDFARGEDMVHSFSCKVDCQAELKELKTWLVSESRKKRKPAAGPSQPKQKTESPEQPRSGKKSEESEKEKLKREIIEELQQSGQPYVPKSPNSAQSDPEEQMAPENMETPMQRHVIVVPNQQQDEYFAPQPVMQKPRVMVVTEHRQVVGPVGQYGEQTEAQTAKSSKEMDTEKTDNQELIQQGEEAEYVVKNNLPEETVADSDHPF